MSLREVGWRSGGALGFDDVFSLMLCRNSCALLSIWKWAVAYCAVRQIEGEYLSGW